MSPSLRVDTGGTLGKPTIVFMPALGAAKNVWDEVWERLGDDYFLVCLTLPGHDGNPPHPGPLPLADIAAEVARMSETEPWGEWLFVGLSIGGGVAIELALNPPPGLVGSAMFCASARFGTEQMWRERAEQVRTHGMSSLVDVARGRWFTEEFIEAHPDRVDQVMADLTAADNHTYASLCEALAVWDARERVSQITLPMLVLSGAGDVAAAPAQGMAVAEKVEHATFVCIPGASHLAPIERPDEVAAVLTEHARHVFGVTPDTGRVAGFGVRRQVLGDDIVTASHSSASPITHRFQDFVTRYGWGEVWTDGTLSAHQRSIATLAAVVTLGDDKEIALHIAGARRNGVEWAQIAELFRHLALYAGVPRANKAMGLLNDAWLAWSDSDATASD